jgi:NADH:ubiquinone oxidoreductase subunit E
MKSKAIEVELCLGSACYGRGNGEAINLLEEYIQSEALEGRVSLKGRLCAEECASGPCISIDGELHTGVLPECAVDLLRYHIKKLDSQEIT